jgi:hypothetical protein
MILASAMHSWAMRRRVRPQGHAAKAHEQVVGHQSKAVGLRVYMRSKMIKHNKDLLQCVGDTYALLEKLHIY